MASKIHYLANNYTRRYGHELMHTSCWDGVLQATENAFMEGVRWAVLNVEEARDCVLEPCFECNKEPMVIRDEITREKTLLRCSCINKKGE